MAYLSIRVSPGARQNTLGGWQGDVLLVRVRAAPERGRANEAACRLLAKRLGLPPTYVNVARGAAARDKLLHIEGLTEEELLQRLGR